MAGPSKFPGIGSLGDPLGWGIFGTESNEAAA